jgi:hypothetical protein
MSFNATVTFVSAARPITKFYFRNPDGSIGHDTIHPLLLSSHEVVVRGIEDLYKEICERSALGQALYTGRFTRTLVNERRKDMGDKFALLPLLIIDADGIPDISCAAHLIDHLPACFQNVSYVEQLSPSMGVRYTDRYAGHIFFLLDKPLDSTTAIAYLKHLNLTTPFLTDRLTLTPTGVALSYRVDIALGENERLVYIAPPELRGDLVDVYANERIKLVKGQDDILKLGLSGLLPEVSNAQAKKTINTLREKRGLPKHRLETHNFAGIDVTKNPGHMLVEYVSDDGEFVRINLNGGDSNGYYFVKDNPTIIWNFKQEPPLSFCDINPDEYNRALDAAEKAKRDVEEAIRQANLAAIDTELTMVDGKIVLPLSPPRVPNKLSTGKVTLEDLNKHFAWVKQYDKIWRFEQRNFGGVEALGHALANRFISVGNDTIPAAKAWLRSATRREHDGLIFAPGRDDIVDDNINLWTGWGVEPHEGDIQPFLDLTEHLFANVKEHIDFVLQWAAYPIQNPGAKLFQDIIIWGATGKW